MMVIRNTLLINHPFGKKVEGSEILPYLQIHKLVCHSFLDAGSGHATPRSNYSGYSKQHEPYLCQFSLATKAHQGSGSGPDG